LTQNIYQEQEKVFGTIFSYAVASESTVMIHSENAFIALITMMNENLLLCIMDFNALTKLALFIWANILFFVLF